MSSKGSASGGRSSSSSGSHSSSSGGSYYAAGEGSPPDVKIISGWQHSTYAHRDTERYAYLGKEGGEPTWVDYGPKSSRR